MTFSDVTHFTAHVATRKIAQGNFYRILAVSALEYELFVVSGSLEFMVKMIE